jgi:hypothetical protein
VTAIKSKPILFSGPMVRAILAGNKTQTRRVIVPQTPASYGSPRRWFHAPTGRSGFLWLPPGGDLHRGYLAYPPYQIGDLLWVRETWWKPPDVTPRMLREGADTWPEVIYDADGEADWCLEHGWSRRPSIFMPRWASRITLEVTQVRVQRLRDISEEDAIAEGMERIEGDRYLPGPCDYARWAFFELWNQIHGSGAWDKNPWVWVYTFKQVEKPTSCP